jgi:hypothetical protein
MILVIGMLALTPLAAEPAAWTLARVSFSSGWDATPAVVAIDRGFFAQEGLVVDGLARSSDGAVAQSLVTGSTDFATVPQRTLLVMAALQLPVKVISMNGWGTEIEVVVPTTDTAIKATAHLKGKTIGLGMASEAYPVLIRLLNKAKLRPTDVKIKYLSPNDLTRAFRDNVRLADAVIESRHYTATLVETGQARVALANKDIVSAVGFIGAGARRAPRAGGRAHCPLRVGGRARERHRRRRLWLCDVRGLDRDPPQRRLGQARGLDGRRPAGQPTPLVVLARTIHEHPGRAPVRRARGLRLRRHGEPSPRSASAGRGECAIGDWTHSGPAPVSGDGGPALAPSGASLPRQASHAGAAGAHAPAAPGPARGVRE